MKISDRLFQDMWRHISLFVLCSITVIGIYDIIKYNRTYLLIVVF